MIANDSFYEERLCYVQFKEADFPCKVYPFIIAFCKMFACSLENYSKKFISVQTMLALSLINLIYKSVWQLSLFLAL